MAFKQHALKAVKGGKPTTTKPQQPTAKRVYDIDRRSYWSGPEAEEIIRRVAAGEKMTDEAERLDVMVDPSTAMVWMRRNKLNRRISQATVTRYAADMLNGHWPYTHQGLAFDRYGWLIDGQHRLLAIIESGATVPLQVTVNCDPNMKRAIDQGKSRSTADVATLEARTPVEAAMSAAANRMLCSVEKRGHKGTRTECVDFILLHLPSIIFAIEHIPQNCRVAYAATRAVIARAYYSVDRPRLERFAEILRTGAYTPGEEVVFNLREWIMKRRCRSTLDALEIYCRTEYALLRFIDGQKAARLYAVEKESFPLPEETEVKTKAQGN